MLDQFIYKYTNPSGQKVPNNHGNFVGECVSLVSRYAQEVQAIAGADGVLYLPVTGGARDLWEQYSNPSTQYKNYYDKVAGPGARGDLVVWGANRGKYGHVAIYLGNGQVFQQLGTPVFQPAAVAGLGAQPPLGYLRRKGQGGDEVTDAQFSEAQYKQDVRMDGIQKSIDSLYTIVDQTNKNIDRLYTTVDATNKNVDKLYASLDSTNKRLDKLEGKK